jgi:hypothetical protein
MDCMFGVKCRVSEGTEEDRRLLSHSEASPFHYRYAIMPFRIFFLRRCLYVRWIIFFVSPRQVPLAKDSLEDQASMRHLVIILHGFTFSCDESIVM